MLNNLLRKLINRPARKAILTLTDKAKALVFFIIDILLSPLIIFSAFIYKRLRRRYFKYFPLSKAILFKIGVYPITDHYYDPMFNLKHLRYPLSKDRTLQGLDLNDKGQLEFLSTFNFNNELLSFPVKKLNDEVEYCYEYGQFRAGDSEMLYSIIRAVKPKQIIEIGSGSSTLMTINAIKKNQEQDASHSCKLTCIEPYENNWLKDLGVTVLRERVEILNVEIFKTLQENDILFIDSSHMVRPQGDVLFEIMEVLPALNKGVIIHIPDIFTPKDYPDGWMKDVYFWNEQYVLEAFLMNNKEYKVLLALNYLYHNHRDVFLQKCPVLKSTEILTRHKEPSSFWIVKC
jgi:hypothetical protein